MAKANCFRPKAGEIVSESPQAAAAFVAYRDMGVGRSLSQLAKRLGKNCSLLERWSSQHDWRERVQEWDAGQMRSQAQPRRSDLPDRDQQRAAVRHREWLAATRAYRIGMQRLDTATTNNDLRAGADLIRLASMMGRLCSDMPVRAVEVSGPVVTQAVVTQAIAYATQWEQSQGGAEDGGDNERWLQTMQERQAAKGEPGPIVQRFLKHQARVLAQVKEEPPPPPEDEDDDL